jgi:hypothetical protein
MPCRAQRDRGLEEQPWPQQRLPRVWAVAAGQTTPPTANRLTLRAFGALGQVLSPAEGRVPPRVEVEPQSVDPRDGIREPLPLPAKIDLSGKPPQASSYARYDVDYLMIIGACARRLASR